MRRIVLVSGTSNSRLSGKIAEFLDISLVDPQIQRFANGEIYCEIEKNIRGADVFIIQSICPPVNDNLMELLIIIDALKRASAASIIPVIPHYGYSRQDRQVNPRSPISAKLVADLITATGANRAISMDLHVNQIQGFFNIPFDNIYAAPIILEYIKKNIFNKNVILISPDAGGVERTRYYAKKLGCEFAIIDKRRIGKNTAQVMNVVGEIEGKQCVILDDMIDTAGTLIEACKGLVNNGATKVFAVATHPMFSDPALDRIEKCTELSQVVVTDTIPLSNKAKSIKKIKVLSMAEVFSKVIHRTFTHDSVSSLFD
ncbi:MAG: ribose-phosphate pyrophosphokinase [Halobacteriovoraceae bacterium]|nr:ribose-phosphate pyrophosphokinase [Halobacteriovoraceae bacterium]